jgi:group I intron endonuclease
MGVLYKMTFPNGKIYIGITKKSFRDRIRQHEACANAGIKTPIYNAWRKYDDPDCKILAIIENHMLAETERKAIEIFSSMVPNGYNCTSGGDGTTGYRHTQEHKEHMSKIKTGMRITEHAKSILSEKAKLRRHSEETKAKISKSGKGKLAWNKGLHHHSEEHKAKMSCLMKGNTYALGMKHSEDSLRKISEASKGNKHSLGMKWFNDGVIEVTRKECPEGFVEGMLKGKHHYNNGLISVKAIECPEGFIPGRLKKQT